ncbi:hypothetical protein CH263_22465 [Rhodococcus sp. 06-1059B-a]|nr:hypothetical protein [Rhodococcus sp. 06-1059B-a]OZD59766.1 hypothetical protein CH263_22465 [Rhodococcus sp. 06-1059B-a]
MSRWLGVRATGMAGVVIIAAAGLVGCADGGSRSQAGGEGLPYGSTKSEYQAAFADIEPIEIIFQSSSAKGALSGRKFEDYASAVTDWSNGKVTFDMQYSSSVAPAKEVDNALVDGRLDLGSPLPVYEPSEYPANDAYIRTMVLGSQTPVAGLLQTQGWISEVGYQNVDVVDELESNGMHVLLPAFSAGSTGLLCSDRPRNTQATIASAQVGITSTFQGEQVKALGATPVSLVFTELFESLQRGVIDCTTSILGAAVLGGFVSEAPHIVMDEQVGFGGGPAALAMSGRVWEGLPLVAQQLFFDRLDAFLGANFEATWENIAEASRQADAAGGAFVQFDPEPLAAITKTNEATLDSVRESSALTDGNELVDRALAANEQWEAKVDELGYTDDRGYEGFADWYQPGVVDLTAYFDQLLGKTLIEHRPV